jgi:hypothetical protein
MESDMQAGARGVRLTRVFLALLVFGLFNIGNEIRYQGCISRQSSERALYLSGHGEVLPVACHRFPVFH